jgi:hypothetical protein
MIAGCCPAINHGDNTGSDMEKNSFTMITIQFRISESEIERFVCISYCIVTIIQVTKSNITISYHEL